MPSAHDVPRLRATTLAAALGQLRARGMRVSATRRELLAALYAADAPVSVEELAAGGLEVASIYRNLAALAEIGLVRHVHVGHGPGLYSVAADEFLACEGCGGVLAADAERFDRVRAAIEREFGFDARFNHFPIVGFCPECQASKESSACTFRMGF